MTHTHSLSITSSFSEEEEANLESFYVSSANSASNYNLGYTVNPSSLLNNLAAFNSKVDPLIYSFAWSGSTSESNYYAQENTMSLTTQETTAKLVDSVDHCTIPPILPEPIYCSALTHPETFLEYTMAEGLTMQPRVTSGITEELGPQNTLDYVSPKSYLNISNITALNSDNKKVHLGAPLLWVEMALLADADSHLPAPFNEDLVTNNSDLWLQKEERFATPLNTSTEKASKHWLNNIGRMLGDVHGVKQASQPEVASNEDFSTRLPPTRLPPTRLTIHTLFLPLLPSVPQWNLHCGTVFLMNIVTTSHSVEEF